LTAYYESLSKRFYTTLISSNCRLGLLNRILRVPRWLESAFLSIYCNCSASNALLWLLRKSKFSWVKLTRDLRELWRLSETLVFGSLVIVYRSPVMLINTFFFVMLGIFSNSSALRSICLNTWLALSASV